MKFSLQAFKSLTKKILSIALPLFSTLFLLGTTAVILVIVNGYSIDINKKQLIKTGVLDIETTPSDASISVNGQYVGNSNRAIPNLTIGNYSINLTKEGYYPYNRNLEIKHGLATIVIAPLLKQSGAEVIATIGPDEITFSNESGLYTLSSNGNETSVTASVSITPTPSPKTDISSKYTLTKYTVQKNFFDPPKPGTPEKMELQAPIGWNIKSYTISPTGKSVFIIMEDSKGQKSSAIMTFKNGDFVRIEQFLTQALNTYVDKDIKVTWSKNSDYLVIETKTQVITYNIKTGTRIILFDKPANSRPFVWNSTDTGVVIIQSLQEDSPEYNIEQISFNGNMVDSAIQKVKLPEVPTNVWANTLENKTIIVVTAEKGAYILGNFYENRVGEYEITSASTKIENRDIESLEKNIVLIKIHDTKIEQLNFVPSKFVISYTDNDSKNLYTFTYNKRAAEHYITLGEKMLISNNETEIRSQKWIFTSTYLLFESNRNLWAIDYTGTNLYQLQDGVSIPTFFLEDSTLLYKGDDSKIYFKTLR